MSQPFDVVVIGAGGGLGSALVEHWLAAGAAPVIAVSRQPQPAGVNSSKLHWLRCDYSDEQLAEVWPASAGWRRGRAGW